MERYYWFEYWFEDDDECDGEEFFVAAFTEKDAMETAYDVCPDGAATLAFHGEVSAELAESSGWDIY